MVPLIVLVISFVVFRCLGLLGVNTLDNLDLPLRIALCLMFLVTASAHWGKGRPDLVRMVPRVFPQPELLVTVTGILEILGAIGLLVSPTSRIAALCLAILLLALFPANIRAAREHLTILGRPAPGLLVRGAIQVVFLTALVAVALHESLAIP
jgi:uncharacterized membrane protein